MIRRLLVAWLVLAVLLAERRAGASEVQVAVAANFAGPMQRIAAEFAKDTKHRAIVVTGATGSLYAQIRNGAPFDVLLSADAVTPKKLESDGLAVPGSRFIYAFGKLVLWSARAGFVDGAGDVLARGGFRHLAIANPKLAPYGAAAMEVIAALGLSESVRPKLVWGESIAQVAQFIETGNAELGFVALSQIAVPDQAAVGSYWLVPAKLYSSIEQDAVLLVRGATNPAARALCEYMRSAKARELIRAFGYALE
jgi:molybdate transport system substrate-binding protein